jgi:hypothetical protein
MAERWPPRLDRLAALGIRSWIWARSNAIRSDS